MNKPNELKHWWNRHAGLAPYVGLHQGGRNYCVFASIAGAVNHLMGHDVWTMDVLADAHAYKKGTTDFSVADTAIAPCGGALIVQRPNSRDFPSQLSPSLIRNWVRQQGIVILSLEAHNPDGSFAGWHMLSVVAESPSLFQVWDSTGYGGLLTDEEIMATLERPPGGCGTLVPHRHQDAIAILRSDRHEEALRP
jgi:hypothetical protein